MSVSSPSRIDDLLERSAPAMRGLLRQAIRFPSVSGQEAEFVRFIDSWARAEGFQADLWETDETSLAAYDLAARKHLPLAGRPTLVITLPGRAAGRSLLINAHSDVVGEGDSAAWTCDPWEGADRDGKILGRGACDVKGPLVAALWAMTLLRDTAPDGLPGDVSLELVPGEEDCVGLGTLTSLVRGHRADGLIVLEPTENLPRRASRGGCRFEIVCRGRAVHGTVRWLGRDAIAMQRRVLEALDRMEQAWNDAKADRCFAAYPIARPISVDSIHGGRWQGMVCDECTCAGYLELLPGDDPAEWEKRFAERLLTELDSSGIAAPEIEIRFSERYDGHLTSASDSIWRAALASVSKIGFPEGFNSGCEAGLRAALQNTPTLVWGPGSLDQAHAADEFIEFAELRRGAALLHDFILRWSSEEVH